MSVVRPEPLTIRSAEDQVYEALRDQIIHGLAPLTPLRLNHLAASLAVSTMPVRVALRRLESEGLVTTLPRRGSRVAPLRVEDIEEIQMMRSRIEGLAARTGAPNVDEVGLAEMRRHLASLQKSIKSKDIDGYVAHLRAFEDVCYQASGWPRLTRMVEDLRRSAERYLRIAVAGGGDSVLTSRFWERFYDAVEAKDGAAAEGALNEALMWTLEWIREYLTGSDQNPVPNANKPQRVAKATTKQ
ncbi:MAG: FCD domain-containing protein [Actinobacteria bacterium]|nr:FCD domain-containing protein [Actinomycetota bacterium]MSW35702.1 FCD domain-containing protein [Actinomycetota bacterium]